MTGVQTCALPICTGYLTFTFGSAPTVFYNQSAGEQLRLDGSDVKASYGNFVPSTAAKGINFTANTPAAGMTSQLLNWYEEGTWTPTRYGFTEVLGAGSITVSGTYTRVGRMVTVIASIIPAGGATIAATAGIGSYLSGLPFMVATPCPGVWVDSSSVAANGGILANATELYIATAWSASVNVKRISATYFV